LVFALTLLGNPVADAQPSPEPDGSRMDDYRAPTATVAGGAVLDTAAAHDLWESGGAVWIDVLPTPRRPGRVLIASPIAG
jgi:hypothetical protein